MRDQLTQLLLSLERELRLQGRWDGRPPPPDALRSTEPFAVDTLSFDQWLQWILLPKMHGLLREKRPLPATCAMQPMAEDVYGKDDVGGHRIADILARIDVLLTKHSGERQ